MTPISAEPGDLWTRLRGVVLAGLKTGSKACFFLLKIIIPVSLAVSLLNYSGVLPWIAGFINPVMKLIGLRGEAALVFVTSILLNNYSAIAVVQTLEFSGREISIMAVMCLVAHNMLVETAVMKKIGSSAIKMVVLRIGMALIAAFLLNLIMPKNITLFGTMVSAAGTVGTASTGAVPFLIYLGDWASSTLSMALKITLFVLGLMVLQRLLDEFKITNFLSRVFAPLMKFFGLPKSGSFLWIVVNTLGYAYGAAVVMDQVKSGAMTSQEADLFNHHAAISHSLLEDTLLWLAVGVSLLWLVPPRLILALVVVWFERFRRSHFRQSFKVGTA